MSERGPIGNPFKGLPKDKVDLLAANYDAAVADKDCVKQFLENKLVIALLATLKAQRLELIEQLISTTPNDIAGQGRLRGMINELDGFLTLLDVKM